MPGGEGVCLLGGRGVAGWIFRSIVYCSSLVSGPKGSQEVG